MSTFHVLAGSGSRIGHPAARSISLSDVADALRLGLDDFLAKPSHVAFLVILYPLIGVVLAAWTSGGAGLHMLFPLMSGFALVGPLAAVGLYEISRRREAGLSTSWQNALDVRHSPALPSILAVGAYLLVVFLAWLLTAQELYDTLVSSGAPVGPSDLAHLVLNTREGLMLAVIGNLLGLAFAVLVLATTSIAFPLLLDRDVGAWEAIATSARVFAASPVAVLGWGVLVAVLLALGSLPFFAGLIVVLPILGHATWHLYRKAVARPGT